VKRIIIWILVIIFVLLLFVVLGLLFNLFYQGMTKRQPTSTPVMAITVTPTATYQAVIASATPIIHTATPGPTFTPVSTATPRPSFTPVPVATNTPIPMVPQVSAASIVNIRSGPSTEYPVIGSLIPGSPLPVTGRNDAGSWWQVKQENGTLGWVSDTVVEAAEVKNIPIIAASPLPQPTATLTPVPTTQPAFQFEPTGWYGDTNAGLTRFFGNITDANGNPVNGVTVEAQCGTYRIISNPSGPVSAFDSNDSVDDPPGFYDITVDKRPIPCKWQLTVVYTEDGKNVLAKLSDTFEVEVTPDKSIIVANWRKNW
jgi:SH3-like domain-containing protein